MDNARTIPMASASLAPVNLAEQIQCNGCAEIYPPTYPSASPSMGSERDRQYGYSARCMMRIGKYSACSYSCWQEPINSLLGSLIATTTIFNQCGTAANALKPVFKALTHDVENAFLFYLDNTTNQILKQQPVLVRATMDVSDCEPALGHPAWQ